MNEDNRLKSISHSLIKSYVIFLPIIFILLIIVVIVGTVISYAWIEPSLPCYQLSAIQFQDLDLTEEEVNMVKDEGGGVLTVGLDGTVEYLGGVKFIQGDYITMEEWTAMISEVHKSSSKYFYSVVYREAEQRWLLIGYPIPMKIEISSSFNTNSPYFFSALCYFGLLFILLSLLAFLFAWLYAKHSVNIFISPLRSLCGIVKRMTRGEYDWEYSKKFIGEFVYLQNDIFSLANQLKNEKELLTELEQNKNQMLLDISHDLRNPLEAITGYVETLQNGVQESQQIERYYDIIYQNGVRANKLINNLFTYSKLNSYDLKMKLENQDVCEFIRKQILIFIDQFEEARFITEYEIPEREIYLYFDDSLMERVFDNLFSNCLKYNPQGTKLKVKLRESDNYIIIIVEDDGLGMEDEISNVIFKPFIRADKSRNSKTGGSGLGLAITSKIIVAHGGDITLKTSPNKGCVFTIRL